MGINDKIKFLRQEADFTKEDLSKRLGVSTMTVRNWEAGVKTPSTTSIIDLADLFGVSTDYILGVASTPEPSGLNLNRTEITLITNYRELDDHGKRLVNEVCNIERDRISSQRLLKNTLPVRKNTIPLSERYIPLYTNPSAAGFSAPLDGDDFEMILVNDNVPANADFAVKIQGDSMHPLLSDGETVYVSRKNQLSNGDIGIFSVDGSMYCKQYYRDSLGNLTLRSANPELQSANLHINADSNLEVKCYGKVLL